MSERPKPAGTTFSDRLDKSATPDSTAERLAELLVAWEEAASSGSLPSVADLCRDCPELAPEVERRIRRLKMIDRFMFPNLSDLVEADDFDDTPAGASRFPNLPGYEILEVLGKGGMGVVYKARQLSLGRLVAIKTLAGSRWGQPGFVVRLRQEAQALSRLNDRHVVQVIDVVETDDVISLVLEYVDGVNLANRQHGAPLAAKEAAQLTLTLAETLARVHATGLLHRDVKPANILISSSGVVKITDFGLAKEAGATDGLTVTGDVLGSPSYMAPEQALGRTSEIDVRTDVYALGATLYQMLTGRRPFVGESVVETLDQVRDQEPVSPRLLNPLVPQDLETICLKCLEKQPARRFATASDLATELQRYVRGEPIQSRPIGAVDRLARWCRRRPAQAGLLALSAAATVVIVALLAFHVRSLLKFNRELSQLNKDLDAAVTTARHMQILAESRERETKDRLYASDINHAVISRRAGDLRAMSELLNGCIPRPGEPDRRGFEWWLLHRQAHISHQVLLDCGSPVYHLCPSPDRRLLAAAGRDAVVRIFDADSGKIANEFATGQWEVNCVAFSPDGAELATAGDDGSIRIWTLATGAERFKIAAHPQKAFQVIYAADGKRIFTCGNDPLIQVFDTQTGGKIQTLDGHQRTVQSLLLADDGKTLVSASDDRTARFWDADSGQERNRIQSEGFVWSLAFDNRHKTLMVGTDQGAVETWNAREVTRISRVKHLDAVGSVALHPSGKFLAAGDRGGSIREWRLTSRGEIAPEQPRAWQAHDGRVHSLVYSSDGSRLISAGGDGRVVAWNLLANDEETTFTRVTVPFANSFRLIPNSDLLVTSFGSRRGLARWNWKSGDQEAQIANWDIGPADVSPDKRWIALSTDDRRTCVSRLDELFSQPLQQAAVFQWEPGGSVGPPRFSPDSQTIAVRFQPDGTDGLADSRQIWLHGPPDFQRAESVPIPGARLAVFTPDGRRLVLTTDTDVVVWDLARHEIVWERPQSEVYTMEISPDGRFVATGGNDRLVIVRNLYDGSSRHRFTSHRARINDMAFSRDGNTLVTASDDGIVKLWHVPTGQELFELRGAGVVCEQLEFDQEGHRLFVFLSGIKDEREAILVYDATPP